MQDNLSANGTSGRRNLLRWFAIGAVGAAVYSLFVRKNVPKIIAEKRQTPSWLPGAGSIFQPREDRRKSR